ncbi:MAG: glycosyltransferase family 39 protein [Caldilineaceae bacterium]|nr:glycosyltransferase family 39 protein [Caldilineaceae bacterium]
MNRPERSSTFPIVWSYCLLAGLFFAPYLLGLSAFAAGDFTRHYLPYSFFQQKSLLAGRLPVWNPHVNSGHPFLADTESAVFYPISNALLLLTSFNSSVVGRLYWLQVEALVHIVLACSFTFLLVHRLTQSRMAGFAAGLVFGFCGYATGYPPLQLGILRVAVWLPLILWLLLPDRTGRPKWSRWLWACAGHAVAFFANHPQTFLFLTYAVGGWMLMLTVAQSRRRPPAENGSERGKNTGSFEPGRVFQHLGLIAVYGSLLIGLTVAQLWPALEFTALSVRSARPFHELSSGFLPQDIWQLFVPRVLSLYSPLYVGMAGIGLASVAVAALLSSRFNLVTSSPVGRPAAIFFAVTALLSILVSFGDLLPIYPLLYRFAPGWSLFRGQERVAYLFAFSLSVLCGYGMALLPSLAARWRRRFGWGYLAIVATGIALVFTNWYLPGGLEGTDTSFFFHASKSLLLATVFVVLCSRLGLRRIHFILVLFVVAVDLFASNFATILADGQKIRSELTRPEIAATLEAAQSLDGESILLSPRVYNERRLPEDSGMVAGWEDVWAASVLRLSAYNGLFVDFPMERMWKLTGVGSVLTWREELPVASRLVEEFPLGNEATRLHQLESIYPRVWWAQKARRVDDFSARALLADPGFDPLQEVLVADSDADVLGEAWVDGAMHFGEGGEATIEATRAGHTRLEVRIESTGPGLIFVSENYLPGWEAEWRAGSQPTQAVALPVVRANQAFLGIPVPAGSGTVDLAYRPASLRWGMAISVFSWVALVVVLRGRILEALRTTWKRIRHSVRALRQFDPSTSAIDRGGETGGNGNGVLYPMGWGVFSDAHFQRVVVVLATVAGFALRFFQLGDQELVTVEAVSYRFGQLPVSSLIHMFSEGGSATFSASYWLNHFWLRLAGSSEFALRSVSALLGTLTIPLLYRLARELGLPAFAALTATVLMAVGSYAVRASQEALLNPLSLTLTVASAVLAIRLISGSKNRAIFLAYVLCAAATFYTQVFAVLALLAQNLYVLYLLVRKGRSRAYSPTPSTFRSMLTRWAWAQLSIVVLCVPWLLSAWNGTFELRGGGTANPFVSMLWWRFAGYPIGELVPGRVWLLNAGIFGSACIAAAIIGGFHLARRRTYLDTNSRQVADGIEDGSSPTTPDSPPQVPGQSPMVFILLLLAMAPLAYWEPLRRHWFMYGSLYAVTLPPYLLLMATGLTRIGDWIESWLGWRWRAWTDVNGEDSPTLLSRIPIGRVAAAILVLILVAGNLFTWRSYHSDPEFSSSRGLREVSTVLEGWSAGLYLDEVHILQSFPDPTLFLYYYRGEVEDSVLPRHDHDLKGATEAVNALRDSNVMRVILPVSLNDDQEGPNLARQALASSYLLTGQETFGAWQVELYSRPNPEAWLIVEVEFANGLVLERAEVSPQWPPAGGQLVVHMEWRGDPSALTGGEKIFMHLVDESGNLVAQWDPEFRMESANHSIAAAMPIPSEVPDGSLRLLAGLYDVSVEGAPRILTDSGEDVVQIAFFRFTDCDVCGR